MSGEGITVTVKYFAIFRESAGVDSESVDTSATTAGELFAELADRHRSSEPLHHCKVAINDKMAEWSASLRDGDVVLLFPPVAGG